MTEPILHVYAQKYPHEDLHIMGNRLGLLLLIESIYQSILDGAPPHSCSAGALTADGEGFDIIVHLEQQKEAQNSYTLPYMAAEYQDQEPNPCQYVAHSL